MIQCGFTQMCECRAKFISIFLFLFFLLVTISFLLCFMCVWILSSDLNTKKIPTKQNAKCRHVINRKNKNRTKKKSNLE